MELTPNSPWFFKNQLEAKYCWECMWIVPLTLRAWNFVSSLEGVGVGGWSLLYEALLSAAHIYPLLTEVNDVVFDLLLAGAPGLWQCTLCGGRGWGADRGHSLHTQPAHTASICLWQQVCVPGSYTLHAYTRQMSHKSTRLVWQMGLIESRDVYMC